MFPCQKRFLARDRSSKRCEDQRCVGGASGTTPRHRCEGHNGARKGGGISDRVVREILRRSPGNGVLPLLSERVSTWSRVAPDEEGPVGEVESPLRPPARTRMNNEGRSSYPIKKEGCGTTQKSCFDQLGKTVEKRERTLETQSETLQSLNVVRMGSRETES